MASRAPGQIYMKFDHFSIKSQLGNGLKRSRLDSYQIWLFLNWESIKNGPKSSRLDSYEIWLFFN